MRARRGDPAFEEFARAETARLLRTARWLTGGDSNAAEEIAQETLVKVFLKWSQVSAADNPTAYVGSMLYREFLTYMRKHRNSPFPAGTDPAPVAEGGDPTAPIADRLTLESALATLPPQQRAAVVLKYYRGQSGREIGLALGIEESSARVAVSRGVQNLRNLLERTEGIVNG